MWPSAPARTETTYSSLPKGGVSVEENWDSVVQLHVNVLEGIDDVDIKSKLPKSLAGQSEAVEKFIRALYKFYAETGFAYLEINPFAIQRWSHRAPGYGGKAG